MKISKNILVTISFVTAILLIVFLSHLFYSIGKSQPTANQTTSSQTSTTSPKAEPVTYQSPIARERINVGEKFFVKGGQVYETDLAFTANEEKEITITSVKHVYLQDIGNGHTLFQGCFIVFGGYSCVLFLLNNFDQLVQLTPTTQYDFREGKDYEYETKTRIALDITNSVSKDFFVRPNEAPYIYQIVQCGDATTGSTCSVIGLNPDKIDPNTGIASKYLASMGGVDTFGLNAGGAGMAEHKISRSIFATTTLLVVREAVERDSKTKHVSIFLTKNSGDAIQLFEGDEDVDINVKLDYDYINLADISYIYIGSKKFTFSFLTDNFTKVNK